VVKIRRAALISIQDRGQVLGVDISTVPEQDGGCGKIALVHAVVESKIDMYMPDRWAKRG